MRKIIYLAFISLLSIQSFGQMIMSASGVNPENVCKPNTVYFLSENRAKPLEPMDSIEVSLNSEIKFAIENPTFNGNAAIQFAVNCQGQVGGGFHMVTKSGNDILDNKLIDFFKTIKKWQAGKIRKKTVDSWYMWRLEIKNGHITILNK
jgi:hypothetical protein